ncbi:TRIGALACTOSYLDIACYLGLYCEROL chloroplastic [Chlorella sorokiniana]|uniref:TRIGALACTOSYLDIACYLGLYCEROL chloroplastic n=1 Tax=Chlorella sorokiniana TaxID=3076 RepID=A0A2P6TTK9_CHLSO|nr:TRIGALACTOSYLDIACYLGLYCEROL chloroplastic [Chlorella sorokiniana]|eukprot:PRW57399.1 TRIGALACTOSYLDIACYLGLYCEROL chloroplastic [Chlorella sorokiniana]
MPIVSEKAASRQNVKSSIASQFWEQPVHSTKSLDGQLWSLPCEPPALNLTGSSGLSRTQQLLAAQAVRVPFFPSYDGASDGVVLDRVIAKAGGRRWWTALSGRVKAQRAYNLGASGRVGKLEAVRDLGNYGLCARSHVQLGRRLTLNAVVEAPDTHALVQRLSELREAHAAAAASRGSGGPAEPGPSAAAASLAADGPAVSTAGGASRPRRRRGHAANPPELEPCMGHASLRFALPGHDLTATAGYNLQYVDSTGDVSHVPLAVSLDLASHDRQDGLQYRVGLHQVTAPATEAAARPGHSQRWRTSLHAQGALAVEGEAHIWRGGSKDKGQEGGSSGRPAPAGSSQLGGEAAAKPQDKSGGGGEEAGGSEEPRRTKLATALERAKAADEEPSLPLARKQRRGKKEEQVQQHQPGDEAAAVGDGEQPAEGAGPSEQQAAVVGPSEEGSAPDQPAASSGGEAVNHPAQPSVQRQPGAALESFIRPLEQMGERVSEMGERVSDMLHRHTHPQERVAQAAGGAPAVRPDESGYVASSSSDAEEQRVQPPSGSGSSAGPSSSGGGGGASSDAGSPHGSSLFGGLSSQTITDTIQDSVALLKQLKESVQQLTGNVQDGSLQRLSQQLADSRGEKPRRRAYSMLLAQPHLKLNAAMGCLARMPLPPLRGFSFPHASIEPLEPHGSSSGQVGGGSRAAHTRQASTSSLMSRASYSSQLAEAWQPYFKGTALRVFASAGVSGQLGRFTRPFLDYTAASARVDVGLTSPHVVGVVPDPATLTADAAHRPDKHRAFALEGRGAWHALSVSLAQQVFGPVRARVDARFALDPTSIPASEGERSTVKGVLQTALSMRPSLLETVYGFDVVLPGTEGAARLAVWCSPKRRECMAELRLF